MESQYFKTEYSGCSSFDEFKRKSSARIEEYRLAFSRHNISLGYGCEMDSVPLDHSGDPRWICPRHADRTRVADLFMLCPGMVVSGMPPGCHKTNGMIEIKDFPRMSRYPATGFPLYEFQVYVAVQHYYDLPVAVFFKDDIERAQGTVEMPPFSPCYGKEPYGGLLRDLKFHESSFMEERGKPRYKTQIRFRTQLGERPLMCTIPQFAAMLRNGSLRRTVLRDPYEWDSWTIAQNRAEEFGLTKMREPEGGLICYSLEPYSLEPKA